MLGATISFAGCNIYLRFVIIVRAKQDFPVRVMVSIHSPGWSSPQHTWNELAFVILHSVASYQYIQHWAFGLGNYWVFGFGNYWAFGFGNSFDAALLDDVFDSGDGFFFT